MTALPREKKGEKKRVKKKKVQSAFDNAAAVIRHKPFFRLQLYLYPALPLLVVIVGMDP